MYKKMKNQLFPEFEEDLNRKHTLARSQFADIEEFKDKCVGLYA